MVDPPPLFVVTLVDPLILGDPLWCRGGVHTLCCIRGGNMDGNNNLLGCLSDPLGCLGDPWGAWVIPWGVWEIPWCVWAILWGVWVIP
jgi:hypothetical protein